MPRSGALSSAQIQANQTQIDSALTAINYHLFEVTWCDEVKLLMPLQLPPHTMPGWTESRVLRNALGRAADASEWYKRQSWAQQWADAISPHLDDPTLRDTDLIRKISSIREWIDHA